MYIYIYVGKECEPHILVNLANRISMIVETKDDEGEKEKEEREEEEEDEEEGEEEQKRKRSKKARRRRLKRSNCSRPVTRRFCQSFHR